MSTIENEEVSIFWTKHAIKRVCVCVCVFLIQDLLQVLIQVLGSWYTRPH